MKFFDTAVIPVAAYLQLLIHSASAQQAGRQRVSALKTRDAIPDFIDERGKGLHARDFRENTQGHVTSNTSAFPPKNGRKDNSTFPDETGLGAKSNSSKSVFPGRESLPGSRQRIAELDLKPHNLNGSTNYPFDGSDKNVTRQDNYPSSSAGSLSATHQAVKGSRISQGTGALNNTYNSSDSSTPNYANPYQSTLSAHNGNASNATNGTAKRHKFQSNSSLPSQSSSLDYRLGKLQEVVTVETATIQQLNLTLVKAFDELQAADSQLEKLHNSGAPQEEVVLAEGKVSECRHKVIQVKSNIDVRISRKEQARAILDQVKNGNVSAIPSGPTLANLTAKIPDLDQSTGLNATPLNATRLLNTASVNGTQALNGSRSSNGTLALNGTHSFSGPRALNSTLGSNGTDYSTLSAYKGANGKVTNGTSGGHKLFSNSSEANSSSVEHRLGQLQSVVTEESTAILELNVTFVKAVDELRAANSQLENLKSSGAPNEEVVSAKSKVDECRHKVVQVKSNIDLRKSRKEKAEAILEQVKNGNVSAIPSGSTLANLTGNTPGLNQPISFSNGTRAFTGTHTFNGRPQAPNSTLDSNGTNYSTLSAQNGTNGNATNGTSGGHKLFSNSSETNSSSLEHRLGQLKSVVTEESTAILELNVTFVKAVDELRAAHSQLENLETSGAPNEEVASAKGKVDECRHKVVQVKSNIDLRKSRKEKAEAILEQVKNGNVSAIPGGSTLANLTVNTPGLNQPTSFSNGTRAFTGTHTFNGRPQAPNSTLDSNGTDYSTLSAQNGTNGNATNGTSGGLKLFANSSETNSSSVERRLGQLKSVVTEESTAILELNVTFVKAVNELRAANSQLENLKTSGAPHEEVVSAKGKVDKCRHKVTQVKSNIDSRNSRKEEAKAILLQVKNGNVSAISSGSTLANLTGNTPGLDQPISFSNGTRAFTGTHTLNGRPQAPNSTLGSNGTDYSTLSAQNGTNGNATNGISGGHELFSNSSETNSSSVEHRLEQLKSVVTEEITAILELNATFVKAVDELRAANSQLENLKTSGAPNEEVVSAKGKVDECRHKVTQVKSNIDSRNSRKEEAKAVLQQAKNGNVSAISSGSILVNLTGKTPDLNPPSAFNATFPNATGAPNTLNTISVDSTQALNGTRPSNSTQGLNTAHTSNGPQALKNTLGSIGTDYSTLSAYNGTNGNNTNVTSGGLNSFSNISQTNSSSVQHRLRKLEEVVTEETTAILELNLTFVTAVNELKAADSQFESLKTSGAPNEEVVSAKGKVDECRHKVNQVKSKIDSRNSRKEEAKAMVQQVKNGNASAISAISTPPNFVDFNRSSNSSGNFPSVTTPVATEFEEAAQKKDNDIQILKSKVTAHYQKITTTTTKITQLQNTNASFAVVEDAQKELAEEQDQVRTLKEKIQKSEADRTELNRKLSDLTINSSASDSKPRENNAAALNSPESNLSDQSQQLPIQQTPEINGSVSFCGTTSEQGNGGCGSSAHATPSPGAPSTASSNEKASDTAIGNAMFNSPEISANSSPNNNIDTAPPASTINQSSTSPESSDHTPPNVDAANHAKPSDFSSNSNSANSFATDSDLSPEDLEDTPEDNLELTSEKAPESNDKGLLPSDEIVSSSAGQGTVFSQRVNSTTVYEDEYASFESQDSLESGTKPTCPRGSFSAATEAYQNLTVLKREISRVKLSLLEEKKTHQKLVNALSSLSANQSFSTNQSSLMRNSTLNSSTASLTGIVQNATSNITAYPSLPANVSRPLSQSASSPSANTTSAEGIAIGGNVASNFTAPTVSTNQSSLMRNSASNSSTAGLTGIVQNATSNITAYASLPANVTRPVSQGASSPSSNTTGAEGTAIDGNVASNFTIPTGPGPKTDNLLANNATNSSFIGFNATAPHSNNTLALQNLTGGQAVRPSATNDSSSLTQESGVKDQEQSKTSDVSSVSWPNPISTANLTRRAASGERRTVLLTKRFNTTSPTASGYLNVLPPPSNGSPISPVTPSHNSTANGSYSLQNQSAVPSDFYPGTDQNHSGTYLPTGNNGSSQSGPNSTSPAATPSYFSATPSNNLSTPSFNSSSPKALNSASVVSSNGSSLVPSNIFPENTSSPATDLSTYNNLSAPPFNRSSSGASNSSSLISPNGSSIVPSNIYPGNTSSPGTSLSANSSSTVSPGPSVDDLRNKLKRERVKLNAIKKKLRNKLSEKRAAESHLKALMKNSSGIECHPSATNKTASPSLSHGKSAPNSSLAIPSLAANLTTSNSSFYLLR